MNGEHQITQSIHQGLVESNDHPESRVSSALTPSLEYPNVWVNYSNDDIIQIFTVQDDVLMDGEIPFFGPVMFSAIDESTIAKAALYTEGTAGPSDL